MIDTGYFQFWWEKTGCLIEREIKTPDPQAPADYSFQILKIYDDWVDSRIVDLTNQITTVDTHDKQRAEKYLLYLDRKWVGLIQEGDRVSWNRQKMGQNSKFLEDNTENTIVGYIHRLLNPQDRSINGSLHCYITTNN